MRACDRWPQLDAYAEPLAVTLGRSAEQIRQDGLGAGDFPHGFLDIRFADGSQASFNWAFHVVSADERSVAVFTEHCGYFEFSAWELLLGRDGREIYRSRYPDGWKPDYD